MSKEIDTRYTQDRELSWLRFNERVLDEAKDESVPLIERLKFAAIFTSNLDEFFMIRVGSLHDMTLIKETHIDNKTGQTPQQQLQAIFKAVGPLYKQRDRVMDELTARCRACNICAIPVSELDDKEEKQVSRWFENEVRPILSPQVVDIYHPFPHLPSKGLSIALKLSRDGREEFGILPVPSSLPPLLRLDERGVHYVLTEDVLLSCAERVFDRFTVTERAVISVTRNADIAPEDEAYDVAEDFRQHMRKVMKKRARLAPVRLEIQGEAGEAMTIFLCRQLNLTREQVFFTRAPIKLDYVFSLASLLPKESVNALCYPPYTPVFSPLLRRNEKIMPQVLHRDVLLSYPYESMEPFISLIAEAAADSSVLSIKITIYRLSDRARLAELLCAAAESGKQVTVLMELRARFDEQNNIGWAERMEEAGCTVLHGSEGIKVHSKICLITRRERGRVRYITQIGTGNYNEKTAKQYTDLCLITADQEIGEDAAELFRNLATANFRGSYRRLLVSPFALRDRVIELIDGEKAKGREGYIFLKLNSLTDRTLIDKLAEASQAGVEITMNIRGICCLLPGVKGLTDHVRVFSIVGRYLEHSRIYCFGKGEEAQLYISSADFMTRNTERRVEAACPVLSPPLRRRIQHMIEEMCLDNVKSRVMLPDGSYRCPSRAGEMRCCQEIFQTEALTAAEDEPRAGILSALRRLLRAGDK
ncbi:MAG: polyphosphate kinase 1 [Oscillospiraceae bacterium]|nr:polyphosphate kinase 1 [Oscillospiraceae bacterium]